MIVSRITDCIDTGPEVVEGLHHGPASRATAGTLEPFAQTIV
jgi:hypothetical protein